MTYAVAVYNAGSGAVEKYGGVPSYGETQNYVVVVAKNYNRISLKFTRLALSDTKKFVVV